MTATELNFDTGIKEFRINGAVTVHFNPTDTAFVERLYGAFTDLEKNQDEYQKRIDEIGDDGEKLFEYANERDAEMRAIIDNLLGEGVADALFVNMNCYALSEGLPIWLNLMFVIAETIEKAFTTEQKKSDPRLKKFSKKYDGMMAKYKRKK